MKTSFKIFVTIFRLKVNYLFLKLFSRHVNICGHFSLERIKINNKGGRNVIFGGKNVVLRDCKFNFHGCNHKVIFGNNVNIKGVEFNFEKNNSTILIGDNVWIGEGTILSAMCGTEIIIGKNSILAKGCQLRTSDSHKIYIYDIEINKPKSIVLGEKCWLGDSVFVLKGSNIQKGCVVGACSVVTSNSLSEPNSILCGIPAKIIKKNISWEL